MLGTRRPSLTGCLWSQIRGWVFDVERDFPDLSSPVSVIVDGIAVVNTTANVSRPDLVPDKAPGPHKPEGIVRKLREGNLGGGAQGGRDGLAADGRPALCQQQAAALRQTAGVRLQCDSVKRTSTQAGRKSAELGTLWEWAR